MYSIPAAKIDVGPRPHSLARKKIRSGHIQLSWAALQPGASVAPAGNFGIQVSSDMPEFNHAVVQFPIAVLDGEAGRRACDRGAYVIEEQGRWARLVCQAVRYRDGECAG